MKLLTKLIIIDRIIPVGGKKMKRNIIIVLIAICTLFILISCYIYIINKNKIPVLCYHNLATAEEKTNFELGRRRASERRQRRERAQKHRVPEK